MLTTANNVRALNLPVSVEAILLLADAAEHSHAFALSNLRWGSLLMGANSTTNGSLSAMWNVSEFETGADERNHIELFDITACMASLRVA